MITTQPSYLSTPPLPPHTPTHSLLPAQLPFSLPATASMALAGPPSLETGLETRAVENDDSAHATFMRTISDSVFSAEFAEWDVPLQSPRPVPSSDRFFFDAQDRSLLSNPYSQQQQSSVKRLSASQSNVQSLDFSFYRNYSPSLPTSLHSSPKRVRSTPKLVPHKTKNWEPKIDEVAPEETKNRSGRDKKQQEQHSYQSSNDDSKDREILTSGRAIRQQRGGMFRRARSHSSSSKDHRGMDGKPLQSYEASQPLFDEISADAKGHGKLSSGKYSLRRSEGWALKDLWRTGDSKVHSRENFGSFSKSSPVEEKLSKVSAVNDVRRKANETRKVQKDATEMTRHASWPVPSIKSPKGSATPHAIHYSRHKADAEQKRMTTFITYRPSLLACVGFGSKSFRAAVGTQSFRASA